MADQFTYPLLPQSPCLTEEQLLAYIDGKMSAAEQHEAELHITDCAMCSDAVDGWHLVKDRKKALAFPAEVTMATPANPAEATQEEEKPEPKVIPLQHNRRRLWMSIAASVAVILVIAATITIIAPGNDQQLAENTNAKKPGSPAQPLPTPPAEKNITRTDSPPVAENLPKTIIEVGPTSYYSKEKVVEAELNDFAAVEYAAAEAAPPVATDDAMTMSEILTTAEDLKLQEKALVKDEAKTDKATRDRQAAPAARTDSTIVLANTTSVSTGSTSSTTWNSNAQQEQLSDVVISAEQTKPKKSTSNQSKERAEASQPSSPGANVAVHPSYSLGMQYMQKKKYAEAVAEFDKVLAAKTNLNYADAQWQKAVALIKLGKKAEAKTLLQEIVNANGFYKTQAEAELKKL
jgi:tetratricopeptide (TPR) repeat protein